MMRRKRTTLSQKLNVKSIFLCLMVSGVILWIVFADYVLSSSKRIDWDSMDAGDCVDDNRRFYCVRSVRANCITIKCDGYATIPTLKHRYRRR